MNNSIEISTCSELAKSTSYENNVVANFDAEELIIFGFDLIFSKFSKESINKIAKDIGGDVAVNFDFDLGCVTYKFERSRTVLLSKVLEAHQLADETGKFLALKHGCDFEQSDLYLRASKKWLQTSTGSHEIENVFVVLSD